MARIRASRGFWAAIGAIALVPPVAFVGLSLTTGTHGERVAALDDSKVQNWIDTNRAILEDYGGPKIKILDLRSGATSPGSYQIAYVTVPRTSFGELHPSPDGRWLLFTENAWSDNPERPQGQRCARFLLASTTGAPPPWKQSSPRFTQTYVENVIWLPDSSGWAAQCADDKPFAAHRYSLTAPDSSVALPANLSKWHKSAARPQLVAVQPNGDLIFQSDDDDQLFRVSHDPTVPVLPLRIQNPDGLHPLPGLHPLLVPMSADSTQRWPSASQRSSDALSRLICLPAQENPIAMDFRQRFHLAAPGSSFVRLSVDAPPQMLLTVRDRVTDFSLAPDGKTLVYWADRKAYRTTLP